MRSARPFQVLLDPGVLVKGVDRHLGAPGDDLGGELALGAGADLAAGDHLDLVGAADVDVVGHGGLEGRSGLARGVEDDGAGHLDLAHGQLPPVAGCAVEVVEGRGDGS